MFDYLNASFARKRVRRITRKYPYQVDTFQLEEEGPVEFANWKNPLIPAKTITQGEVNFFRKLVPLNSFCLDIGANIGDTTVPMALGKRVDAGV